MPYATSQVWNLNLRHFFETRAKSEPASTIDPSAALEVVIRSTCSSHLQPFIELAALIDQSAELSADAMIGCKRLVLHTAQSPRVRDACMLPGCVPLLECTAVQYSIERAGKLPVTTESTSVLFVTHVKCSTARAWSCSGLQAAARMPTAVLQEL
jgi:hypothetical protein